MKKFILASAFALMGTFALAGNAVEVDNMTYEAMLSENNDSQCTVVKVNCQGALIYCWKGELDPDAVKNAAEQFCKDISQEEDCNDCI
ncbi:MULTISPECIES: hypothetical protein [Weeksella]|uniref:hypothetical protein n=1 Tax=Weeksella TaxID=1013 RepID=UPI0008A378E9|nr:MULTISPECIES: hypothetical protein [Weeksella]MDK7375896.1 hypothetical protein [Weeksella virosa]OFM83824.1 hypothetical protein HMPREF2660_09855 [Weeksella sp. HMSC059D05]